MFENDDLYMHGHSHIWHATNEPITRFKFRIVVIANAAQKFIESHEATSTQTASQIIYELAVRTRPKISRWLLREIHHWLKTN